MKQYSEIDKQTILDEWIDGLEITALRAMHRYYTLSFLLERRMAQLHKEKYCSTHLIQEAQKIRHLAQTIVYRREAGYRYPLASLAREKYSHTAYQYGYLYPVSNLHFWLREEQQALQNKWRFTFMNIWDIFKIIGLKE